MYVYVHKESKLAGLGQSFTHQKFVMINLFKFSSAKILLYTVYYILSWKGKKAEPVELHFFGSNPSFWAIINDSILLVCI